jgi:plastocyanin
MSKSTLLASAVVVIVVAAGAIFVTHRMGKKQDTPPATNSSQNASNDTSTTPSDSSPGKVTGNIEITDNMIFTPSQISISKGEAVTWTNNDNVAHTVTDDLENVGGPKSTSIAPGATYTFTFTKSGSFQYHCEFHHEMRGTIVVK